MTDNEIIKAFELCFAEKGTKQTCEKCPYHKFGELCKVERDKDAFDLINRQQAEIERLGKASGLFKYVSEAVHHTSVGDVDFVSKEAKDKAIKELIDRLCNIQTIKSEAIKEFITKHREMMLLFCDDDDQISLKVCEYDVNTKGILEEMVGEDK